MVLDLSTTGGLTMTILLKVVALAAVLLSGCTITPLDRHLRLTRLSTLINNHLMGLGLNSEWIGFVNCAQTYSWLFKQDYFQFKKEDALLLLFITENILNLARCSGVIRSIISFARHSAHPLNAFHPGGPSFSPLFFVAAEVFEESASDLFFDQPMAPSHSCPPQMPVA